MLHQELNRLIAGINPDMTAAEAHGMAAGILCVNERAKPEFWLHELMSDYVPVNIEANETLTRFFEETRQSLINEDFSFDLLLPDEDDPLGERLEALTTWCNGFLYGMGAANLPSDLSEDSREIVKDIMEFTKLDTDANGEESENDFMELTEYLRASVVFLCIELHANNNGTVH